MRFSLGLLAGLALLPGLAAAQTALPDTIVTGTRVPTPAERVPASVTVIDRATIDERGYTTLAEALQDVPGMRLLQSGGMGQQASAFLRGAGSRNVLVLLDGVPVNDPSEANGAFNFGNEMLFDIERIEVLRGPASALYGSAAIGGVVNMVTRRAPEGQALQTYGELAGGTQRTLRGGLGATGTVQQFDYLFSGQSMSTQGSNAMAPRFYSNQGERDGFRGAATTARLGYTPLPGTRFEALLRWRENKLGLDNVPQDDPNYSGNDRRWYGQLRGETQLFDGAWTTGLRVASTQDRRIYANQPDTLNSGSTYDRYLGTRNLVDWGNSVRLPSLGALTDGAFGFGLTHVQEQAESAAGSDYFRSSMHAQQHSTGGYGTLQYRAFERLDLTAGLRHDATTGFTDATTWRLGAVLALPEVNARLRGAIGTGFSAPSLFQRFGVIPGYFQGNPNLLPERSLGWEIGAEVDIPAFGRQRFATAGVTYFGSKVRDLINYTAAYDTLENVDRARIDGVELALTLRPAPWLETTGAWTITEAIDEATHQRLPRRPEHVATLSARIVPMPGVVIAPRVMFTGRSPEAPYASYDNAGNAYDHARSNPAGAVFSMTASWQAFDKAALFLEARNLGNSRFEPANGFVIPGRSVLLGTRFSL